MKIDWVILNAYVDGELDAGTAATVAAAAAASPDLAARIASLSRLKAETAQRDTHPAMPAPVLPPRPTRHRPVRRRTAIAALIGLVAVAGALGLWQPWRGVADPAWLAAAVTAQESWLARAPLQDDGKGRATMALLPAAMRHAPDLTDAHLRLVYAESLGGSLFFGYQGIHGCRVGLWIAGHDGAATGIAGTPALLQRNRIHAFAWRRGDDLHLLMARGMPDARLGRLAELVATLLDRDRRIDDGLRLALQATAGMAPPCA